MTIRSRYRRQAHGKRRQKVRLVLCLCGRHYLRVEETTVQLNAEAHPKVLLTQGLPGRNKAERIAIVRAELGLI